MLNRIKEWLVKDREYYSDLNARLHLAGNVRVPKDVIRNSEIFDSGYIYELELGVDGFMEITAHKKMDLLPINNVIQIKNY
jgi:hypothetical protein